MRSDPSPGPEQRANRMVTTSGERDFSSTSDTSREGCDVRLKGDDWTVTEVLRSLGELTKRVTIEVREMNDGTHLLASGSPEALIGVLMSMPVVGVDRDRVLRRILPMTSFTTSDLKKFRNPAGL